MRDAGNTVVLSMVRSFAAIWQYLLPILFLSAAGASAIGTRKRQRLAQSVAESTDADPLKSLSWTEFEQLVGEAFRQQGYQVVETPAGPDGGVDLVLRKDGEKILAQCKHWRATKVGVPIVRELFGVMADRGAAGACVTVHSRPLLPQPGLSELLFLLAGRLSRLGSAGVLHRRQQVG